MSNPLYDQMMPKGPNIFDQVKQLQAVMKGDPRQHIQQLLNSGRVSQAQYNAAVQKAQQMMNIFRR